MSTANRRVFQLARIARRAEGEVLAMLRAAGVAVQRPNDLVPLADVERSRRLLGIDPGEDVPATLRDQHDALVNHKSSEAARGGDSAKAAEVAVERSDGEADVGARTAVEANQAVAGTSEALPLILTVEKNVISEARPRLPKWSTVGHPTNDMAFLDAVDVERIHWILVEDFRRSKDPIEPPGVKSMDLLESALYRVRTALGGQSKYPTVPMAAAAMLHAIISNHAFHNGNKRTALVATLVFLDLNGYLLEADENELFDYLLKVAAHEIAVGAGSETLADREMLGIARWLHRHSRAISNAEKPIKFHEFRSILIRYNCVFEHAQKGNRMNITREGRTIQVYYRSEGTDVERNTIRMVRQELGLTDEDGYDSAIFYDAAERVPEFIHKYRRTLDRLAKV